MNCCKECNTAYNKTFNKKVAAKDLAAYKKKGPSKSTIKLLNSIRHHQNSSLHEKSLLDIGGGIGAIGLELAQVGARKVTCADVSHEYLTTAEKEVKDRGFLDRFAFMLGDAVAIADEIPEADIVTLDKAICCYEDYPSLIEISTSKTLDMYGIVIPRDVWWVISINAIGNLFRKLTGDTFRTFVHPTNQITGPNIKMWIQGSKFRNCQGVANPGLPDQ